MKLFGVGQLTAKNTNRVVHDFVDGPFETVNQELIKWALECGCTDVEPITEKVEHKRGRPKK
jgi:hypothetical protein